MATKNKVVIDPPTPPTPEEIEAQNKRVRESFAAMDAALKAHGNSLVAVIEALATLADVRDFYNQSRGGHVIVGGASVFRWTLEVRKDT
jgi:enamine deaminase RidA (YjgF/YER057c/UK114 family)